MNLIPMVHSQCVRDSDQIDKRFNFKLPHDIRPMHLDRYLAQAQSHADVFVSKPSG